MQQLRTYNKKRDFKNTSEPEGTHSDQTSRDFMVHLHDARTTHFDLRLQWNGVLLSWAVPKGPSYDPKDKRLAVQTEDHPVEYKSFEGLIPEKNYGAGPSLIWDAGLWRPLVKDIKGALKKGHLRFYLRGVRLRGIWNLIRMKRSGEKHQWLLWKENDKFAHKNSILNIKTIKHELLNREPFLSVATGKSLDDIRENIDDSASENTETSGKLDFIEVSKFPKLIRPQLATLIAETPSYADQWIAERKYDGYRVVAYKKKN